jgi:hypothetical protein
LVPLDSSDIATPDETGPFFLKSQFCVKYSIIRALAVVVFPVSESRLREQPQLISFGVAMSELSNDIKKHAYKSR